MVGENSISAGSISLEYRCRIVSCCAYFPFRACVLLGYLSVGGISGYYLLGIRQAKEEPLSLFTCNEMVAIWCFRSIHYYDGCRVEFPGYSDSTL